ncbi:MAG: hypothetical protein AMXMBFR57_33110 [Acidimicrobiia bacterium]
MVLNIDPLGGGWPDLPSPGTSSADNTAVDFSVFMAAVAPQPEVAPPTPAASPSTIPTLPGAVMLPMPQAFVSAPVAGAPLAVTDRDAQAWFTYTPAELSTVSEQVAPEDSEEAAAPVVVMPSVTPAPPEAASALPAGQGLSPAVVGGPDQPPPRPQRSDDASTRAEGPPHEVPSSPASVPQAVPLQTGPAPALDAPAGPQTPPARVAAPVPVEASAPHVHASPRVVPHPDQPAPTVATAPTSPATPLHAAARNITVPQTIAHPNQPTPTNGHQTAQLPDAPARPASHTAPAPPPPPAGFSVLDSVASDASEVVAPSAAPAPPAQGGVAAAQTMVVAAPAPTPVPATVDNATVSVAASTANVPVAPPVTEDGTPVLARLVETMRWQANAGGGHAEIRLRPEVMGPIAVSIVVDRGRVKATVSAESAQTLEYLRGEASALRESLEERGLRLDEYEVRESNRWLDARDPQRERRESREQEAPRPSRPAPDAGPQFAEAFDIVV